jgi:DNA-binding CsgD family transcriptional regulator
MRSTGPKDKDAELRGRTNGLTGRRDECGVLDQLVNAVQAGESRVLVVRGEPGVGKSAVLDYLAGHAPGCRVVRAAGVESEMELAFAGLHQLLAPVLDRVDRLPVPQREALRTAFGLSAGPAPDRLLVGLAVLGLVSEVAEERPLVCVVDDEQWLDRASVQALGFVARRLAAEPVGLVFAVRVAGPELTGLPALAVGGLGEEDARALLSSALTGPVDERVRDQIIAEARGNPLALLELPRGLSPAQLAGGFGLPGAVSLPGRIEESFRRQLEGLPAKTRRLLAVAAADPSGDPLLVWRAAGLLGIPVEAWPAAAGLVEFDVRVQFRHPLTRSAAYQSASLPERHEIHHALAEATDPAADPDRRAWHRAQAAAGPDEEVAAELERSAGRAQRRGGLAAAAAFQQRAALLTPAPGRRAERLLAAALANRDAGELDAAEKLLAGAEAGPVDALQAAQVQRLRGRIAFDQNRGSDAARLLLRAARLLEPLDVGMARETHLEALAAAFMAGDLGRPGGVREAAEAARAAPPGPDPLRPVDVVLDALALRFSEGYAAAAPALTRALEMLIGPDQGVVEARRWLWSAGGRAGAILALELWDFDTGHALAARQVEVAREVGALVQLLFALGRLGLHHVLTGELAEAARLIEEECLIGEAIGNPPVRYVAMLLEAWRGREREASELIEATVRDATGRGTDRMVGFAEYASAVLDNSLGRYDAAQGAARRAFERDHLALGPLVVAELAEAAARTGDVATVRGVLDWLSERTRVTPTEWALGIEARIRALLSDGEAADGFYRESVERLGRTRIRAELARSRLLYGEWLRRQGRRMDAREQLRTAHQMLEEMGMAAFADRARRELRATGETARKRTAPATRTAAASAALTAQEAQVARLARDGLSNPEIGARLFISPRTAQYHLSSVFSKLGISSRSQLDRVLPADLDTAGPALAAPQPGLGCWILVPLVLGGFAEELEADVPQVVTAVHVAGIGLGELPGVDAGACLFHDYVGGSLLAGLEQPGVVGQPLVGLAVPADAGGGLEFVDGAVDGRAEGDPVERDVGGEEPAGGVDRDVAGVGVPVRPRGGADELLPDRFGGRGDHDVVVGEEVGLLGHDAVRPVDVRRAALDVLDD